MAISVAQARLVSDRRFFVWMAYAMAATVFAGFAQTYFLAGLNDGPRPVLTPLIHIHGALCTAWVLLLVLQTGLIAAGRRDIHKAVGVAGVGIAAFIFLTGLLVATHSHRRVHTAATADTLADPYVFLVFPLTAVSVFALFVTLGALNRRRADTHKRFMLLATASLTIPALARITTQTAAALGIAGVPGVVGAVVLVNAFLVAMVVHDFASRGRLHPVTLWAGGFLLLSEPLRFVVGFSAPWQAFAQYLMT